MLRNIFLLFVAVSFLLTGANVYAMTKTEFQGKITNIKGNVITMTSAKGEKVTVEVKSAEGVKIGDRAWCEQDCRQGIKIGKRVLNFRKTLK